MYYDEKYFEWQKTVGCLGGELDAFKFENQISPSDTVIDFGCGGGYILKAINCKRRIGIEINDTARSFAEQENNIEAYKVMDDVPDEVADVIISNHALEHTDSPYEILSGLLQKLKKGGRLILVVPFEKKTEYKEDDINMHLYTWSKQNIGNLVKHAGYKVCEVSELRHFWPPKYDKIYKLFGKKVTSFLCRIWGWLRPNNSQIKVVATRE